MKALPRSGHQWCLNYSWCGVRLDHRRREAGLSCIPGLTLVSLLDRVEGCYKCQPLRLEAISHTRDAHFRNIRGRSNNNNNNQGPYIRRAVETEKARGGGSPPPIFLKIITGPPEFLRPVSNGPSNNSDLPTALNVCSKVAYWVMHKIYNYV